MIVLPINLKDDDYEGEKKWEQNINDDGTSSFKDVTEYKEKGSDFGATEVNKIHAGIMGFVSSKTTFNDDGTIFEALYDANDTYLGGKTTTFIENGVKEEVIMA